MRSRDWRRFQEEKKIIYRLKNRYYYRYYGYNYRWFAKDQWFLKLGTIDHYRSKTAFSYTDYDYWHDYGYYRAKTKAETIKIIKEI